MMQATALARLSRQLMKLLSSAVITVASRPRYVYPRLYREKNERGQ